LVQGLVISVPMRITEQALAATGAIDPQELRFALLFWDKLAWPNNNLLAIADSPETEFLAQAGVLSRPMIRVTASGHMGQLVAQAHLGAFMLLDREQPGMWALAQGERSFFCDTGIASQDRGILVELYRAIPIPDKDVPLQDILEFREARRPELLRLRNALDELYTKVNNSPDPAFELRRRVDEIQASCSDLIRVAKESPRPFRLSDWRATFELQPGSALAAIVGAAAGQTVGMPEVGALVGGLASTVKITRDIGLRGVQARESPYWYTYAFHREVF
jgi:hypothetical protein